MYLKSHYTKSRENHLVRLGPASLFAALLLTAALWANAGCFRHGSAVDRGNRDSVLHRSIGPEIPDVDPHLATSFSEYSVISALFEGLVSEDPTDLHPVAGVAETWEISSDALTYTFHLRPEAKWSNGDAVTAQDFAQSFQRMLTGSLGADYASVLYVLQNAEPFHKGTLSDFSKVGVAAVDSHTLRLTLEHPTPQFLQILNQPAFFPIPLATIQKYGSAYQRGNLWTRTGNFVGNGPFVLTEWKSGQKIVAKKSPTYWDAERVRLNEIDFYSFDSRDAEERAFRSGQLHLTDAVTPSKIQAYQRDNSPLLRIDPYLGTEFYRININRPFLNDRRVRRALALSVDRERLVNAILHGGQQPATAFTPPGTDGYSANTTLSFDPEAARKLLAEAGYPNGKGTPPVEILFNTSESHRAIAEAIQEMWRRELGLDVRLLNQEFKSTVAARRAGDFAVMRSVWIADYVSPASFLEVWESGSGNNYTGWKNATYDQLLFEAARTLDPTAQRNLYRRAESLLLDDAPIIPIYHYTHVFLIQPSVKNWNPTLLDHHPYKYVYLDDKL
jgi:oligopeptide transport system substrate-binding protein